ncbi:hypothetical protein AURDEDRAFT_174330 [Auricularia subglabra TFB-10046 SS5]|nr:hypothetical protein AURDEDRAFT_174330 [Auricularia subglabra TFB-10046 SS5]
MRATEEKSDKPRQPGPHATPANTAVPSFGSHDLQLPPPSSNEWEEMKPRAPKAAPWLTSKPKESGTMPAGNGSRPSAAPPTEREHGDPATSHATTSTRRSVRFALPIDEDTMIKLAKYEHGICGLCTLLSDWVNAYDLEVYHKLHSHDLYIFGPSYDDPEGSNTADVDNEEPPPATPTPSPPSSPATPTTAVPITPTPVRIAGSAPAPADTTDRVITSRHSPSAGTTAAARSSAPDEERGHAKGTRRTSTSFMFRREPPKKSDCNACSIRDDADTFAPHRAELFDLARAIATSTWEQLPDRISGPMLPLTLGRLALTASDEHALTRLLNDTPDSALYGYEVISLQ